jgi:hypothetical protein
MRMACSLVFDHWHRCLARQPLRWDCSIASRGPHSSVSWPLYCHDKRQHERMTDSHEAAAVNHPVATQQDQAAWEEALNAHTQSRSAQSTKQDYNQATDLDESQLNAGSLPITSHPAVGASRAECTAWEEALGGTACSRPNPQIAGQQVYAVVECGSHSTRLLLSTGSTDIIRLTRDTHLGAVLGDKTQSQVQTQQDSIPAAAAATLAAVQEYKQLIDQHQQQLGGVVAVATAAVREAAEGPSIAAAVGKVLGCPLQVLSGKRLTQQLGRSSLHAVLHLCACH